MGKGQRVVFCLFVSSQSPYKLQPFVVSIGVNSHCSFVRSDLLGMCWLQIRDVWLPCTISPNPIETKIIIKIIWSCNLAVNSVRSLFNLLEIWGKHDLRRPRRNSSFLVSFCSKSDNKTIIRFPASSGSICWSLHEIANMTGPMAGQSWLKPNHFQALDFGTGSERGARSEDVTWQASFIVFGCQVSLCGFVYFCSYFPIVSNCSINVKVCMLYIYWNDVVISFLWSYYHICNLKRIHIYIYLFGVLWYLHLQNMYTICRL